MEKVTKLHSNQKNNLTIFPSCFDLQFWFLVCNWKKKHLELICILFAVAVLHMKLFQEVKNSIIIGLIVAQQSGH